MKHTKAEAVPPNSWKTMLIPGTKSATSSERPDVRSVSGTRRLFDMRFYR